MSQMDDAEFSVLKAWFNTFPQIQGALSSLDDKENTHHVDNAMGANHLQRKDHAMNRAILDVVKEICGDSSEQLNDISHQTNHQGRDGDLWTSILNVTYKSKTTRRRSFVLPPSPGTDPQKPSLKHRTQQLAIGNLLDGAVSHKNLDKRKTYIQRIMALPAANQRALMAIIERRKATRKTPKKQSQQSHQKLRQQQQQPATQQRKRSQMMVSSPRRQATDEGTAPPHPTPATGRRNRGSLGGDGNSRKRLDFKETPQTVRNSHRSQLHAGTGTARSALTSASSTARGTRSSGGSHSTPEHDDGRVAGKVLFSTPRNVESNSVANTRPDSFAQSRKHQTPETPGFGDSIEYDRMVRELREQSEQLEQKLARSEKREQELAAMLDETQASARQKFMKAERDARLRFDESRDVMESEIGELQKKLQQVTHDRDKLEKESKELAGMKDEMDVMSHTKDMLADATERLRQYKERLQQLTDVKEALEREEEAHSRSVEECLRLDNELKMLQPLKHQLEQYKSRATDTEFQLAESEDLVRKLQHEKQELLKKYQDLQVGSSTQNEEIHELQKRMSQDENADSQNALGVGDGISELNPELKAEVLRLRNENGVLREFKAKRSADAVERIEQDIEDSQRLCDRFKSQYLNTKGQLEDTTEQLDKMTTERNGLRRTLEGVRTQLSDAEKKSRNLEQELADTQSSLTNAEHREANLKQELDEWMDQSKQNQARADDLSNKLKDRKKEVIVMKSKNRGLEEHLAESTQSALQAQSDLTETTKMLQKRSDDLQKSQKREDTLKKEVEQWTEEARDAQCHANEMADQLQLCAIQLGDSRTREKKLQHDLHQMTEKATSLDEKTDELSDQVEELTKTLTTTETALEQTKVTANTLQDELADMTGRAEDAESVSSQRMELLQSTKEKLETAVSKLDQLESEVAALKSDLNTWQERAINAESTVEMLQNENTVKKERLETVENDNVRKNHRLDELEKRGQYLSSELEAWTDKALKSEALTEKLQDELMLTREALNSTQISLKSSQEGEEMLKGEVANAEMIISEMESTLELKTTQSEEIAQEAEVKLQTAKEELTVQAKEQQATLRRQLEEKIAAQSTDCEMLKKSLFKAQEQLHEVQLSLGSSQHKEKMMKHETTKLQNELSLLKNELLQSKKIHEESLAECASSLDATRDVLNGKAQKELEELRKNMNLLLEDERKAKRFEAELRQIEIEKLQEEASDNLAELKKTAALEVEKIVAEKNAEITEVRNELMQMMRQVEAKLKGEKDVLVAKGKEMISKIQMNAEEDVNAMEDAIAQLEEKFETVEGERDTIAEAYKTKVAEYKKKFQFSASRINALNNDNDELQDTIQEIEREKAKLKEENERYRRQIGGRFGSSDTMQSQVEVIHKELKDALDEIAELKQRLRNQNASGEYGRAYFGNDGLASIGEEANDLDQSYSRNAMNSSTLVQLRTEYEETIDALSDEKRELVMKHSAAVTDIRKAEKRAWDLDIENADLKQEMTSLQLQIERLQHHAPLSNNRSLVPVSEHHQHRSPHGHGNRQGYGHDMLMPDSSPHHQALLMTTQTADDWDTTLHESEPMEGAIVPSYKTTIARSNSFRSTASQESYGRPDGLSSAKVAPQVAIQKLSPRASRASARVGSPNGLPWTSHNNSTNNNHNSSAKISRARRELPASPVNTELVRVASEKTVADMHHMDPSSALTVRPRSNDSPRGGVYMPTEYEHDADIENDNVFPALEMRLQHHGANERPPECKQC